eukprot:CAMPEP_0114673410 /NCGR_PEP_ID=MMETSP0191-20121206/44674_1 /TAXON_ID=126664 /ORGANISM="Sorites sp." /LENGTH=179 /DNA_ID=CAMNT_0001938313 /DNA_START=1288 /DNA_END=1824 /DNA_ORIENTATION=+
MEDLTDNDWETYFNDIVTVNAMNFKYKPKERPYGYTTTIARVMHRDYDRDKILTAIAGLYTECDANLVREFVGKLTPKNAYYKLISKEFENECDEKEYWYGTQYKTVDISDRMLDTWSSVNKNDSEYGALAVPDENKYIASNFDICCENCDDTDMKSEMDANDIQGPNVRVNDNGKKVW